MSQSHDTTSFADKQDELNREIAVFRQTPDKIRGSLKPRRNLLVNLHNAWIREGRSFEEYADLGDSFAEAVIGDGLKESRVKIFAAVLSLRADASSEIWTCFMSALALANPSAQHKNFRDECIPNFDLDYIQSQLGRESASAFEVQLCVFSPPDTVSEFAKQLEDLQTLLGSVRLEYKTETWTYEFSDDGELARKRHTVTEATSQFCPDQAALNIVHGNKELLRALYVEHFKRSAQYAEGSPMEKDISFGRPERNPTDS